MKIVIAPDSFKGSLTAKEVADYIENGIKKIKPKANTVKIPLADGGEGTVQALVDAHGGYKVNKEVLGPLGKTVQAEFGLIEGGKTAIIEMAAASGIQLIKNHQLNPKITTTYGTGQLINEALEYNIDKLIVGIGGSATNDGGVGMAQALGVSFKNQSSEEIGFGGAQLNQIDSIDASNINPRIKEVEILTACDVNSPFFGPQGATYVYGPQKGADSEMVEELENNMRYLNKKIVEELNIDLQTIEGSGAAGGLGGGLVAFCNASLVSGVDIILEASNIDEKLKEADLVITGEGRIDYQSLQGKTTMGIARRSKKYDVPIIIIAGSIGEKIEYVLNEDIQCVFTAVHKPLPLNEAISLTPEWLSFSAEQIMRLLELK